MKPWGARFLFITVWAVTMAFVFQAWSIQYHMVTGMVGGIFAFLLFPKGRDE